MTTFTRRNAISTMLAATASALMADGSMSQEKITLHGASMFGKDHPFNIAQQKFIELVKSYYGKPVDFVMHENSELGTDRDYMNFMSRGVSVAFAVMSPSNMSGFAKSAALMDMPFLCRDRSHWNKVVTSDALAPIVSEVEKRADVKVLGFVGGGERNIVSKRKVTNLDELKGLKMRVQPAPIHAKLFGALGINPTVIAYTEVYNAIQSGVVDALENEATGIEQIKFYEVAPEIAMTRHSITIRPLVFSGKVFNKLPADLQAAITKAGKEAADFGRVVESAQDVSLLKRLEFEKKLRIHPFADADKLAERVRQIQDEYAKEIEAEQTLKNIRAIR